MRERADILLVQRGFFESRSAARAAIEAGSVCADGIPVRRPGERVDEGARLEASPAHAYVSRGGVKLAHALDAFGIDVAGWHALDLGASTGGFTDVLLQRGAAHVTAVDVGHGQMHPRLAADARVRCLEHTDARHLTPDMLSRPPDGMVCDLSFIGLEKALGPALRLAARDGVLIALFKPQFQVGRAHVGKGGVVRDGPAVQTARARFTDWLAGEGWAAEAWCDSPISGGDGNREWLVLARRVAR